MTIRIPQCSSPSMPASFVPLVTSFSLVDRSLLCCILCLQRVCYDRLVPSQLEGPYLARPRSQSLSQKSVIIRSIYVYLFVATPRLQHRTYAMTSARRRRLYHARAISYILPGHTFLIYDDWISPAAICFTHLHCCIAPSFLHRTCFSSNVSIAPA